MNSSENKEKLLSLFLNRTHYKRFVAYSAFKLFRSHTSKKLSPVYKFRLASRLLITLCRDNNRNLTTESLS